MRKPAVNENVTITNWQKDGTVIEDMTGYKVPYNTQTAAAFRIIEECAGRIQARQQEK